MIVHLDADAFFASVEQAADPKLRGKPVAVGGERRGIIASASYEARQYGIYTPMPSAHARRLCPRLILLPGDFEKYERFSRCMFSYAYDFTPEVEVASIDEGYFDLAQAKAPRQIAESIRAAIGQSLKISVSEGIGSNKLVSQIASKLNKPAALLEVPEGQERPFLWPLENKWLPGVGPKTAKMLDAAGLTHISQIAGTSPELLALLVGEYAPQLHKYANAIDERPVVSERPEAKSYGEQETFESDVTDEAFLLAKLRSMADRLMAKVREDRKSIRTVTVRLRYNDMQEVTRSISLSEPSDLETDIYPSLPGLLKKGWERRVSIRLVGLKLSHIYGEVFHGNLVLGEREMLREKQRQLADVVDRLRSEGRQLMRGHDLWLKSRAGQPREPRIPLRVREKPPVYRRPYVALNVKSHYSFLDSLLSIPAIIEAAKELGIGTVAITDPNLHGAVEFFQQAKEAGLKPVVGAEVCCGRERLNLYVENRAGYRNLCRILSRPTLDPEWLATHKEGLIAVQASDNSLALPEIRYRHIEDRHKYEILQSIRTLTRLHQKHPGKRRGDFHFLNAAEVSTKCGDVAMRRTLELAERCQFEFDFERLYFPNYRPTDGSMPREFLRELAIRGLHERYGERAFLYKSQLEEELAIIHEVGYEEYFLAVWDLLQECRKRGIQWITRGSAADSLVCYCLKISGVCPMRFELYFRRFLNRERMALNKLPDIDLDFAHDRKDDVVDLLFARYGPEHAAVVGGFSTFKGRSAIADIAKTLGVSEFQIRRMTEHLPHASAGEVRQATLQSQECRDVGWSQEPFKSALELASFLEGFPRHAKMHPCGVVLSREPIACFSPVFKSHKGYPTTHLDMDAVEAVGLVKMDILAQGGLAVIRDTLAVLGNKAPDLEALEPWDDPKIWAMIAAGESRGVHHIESPAMLNLARMCNVQDIDRLIAIVSVIRPGAANSAKKAQFARRAQGLEPIDYIHPSLEPVLHSTFGVVAYEEHILQICEAFAGLAPGRADILRRALVKQQSAKIEEIRCEFFAAARALGRSEEQIAEVWELVHKFQGYAFCRAHSTAYGLEAYQGAYLKCYHPVEFMAAILSNGKGFYSALAYTIECRRIGIGFLSPDVNGPVYDFRAEHEAIRVPLSRIKDLGTALLERCQSQQRKAAFLSLRDFYLRTSATVQEMQNLIRVGAFDSLGQSRTTQFWELQSLAEWPEGQGTLFAEQVRTQVPAVPLTEPDFQAKLRDEFELLRFTVSGHPLDLHPGIGWGTYCPIKDLGFYKGKAVTICGLIIEERLHSQVGGELMKFITVCDYTGIIECEIFAQAYRHFGINTVRYPVIELVGQVESFENNKGYTLKVTRIQKPRVTRKL